MNKVEARDINTQGRLKASSIARAHHALCTEINRSKFMSLKFPFAEILTGTIIAL